MKKIICIYHSRDLDGWMSAAIVKKWFINNNSEDYSLEDLNTQRNVGRHRTISKEIYTDINYKIPQLHFLGWDYGDEIPNLSEYDKVIMCDVSFPKEEMYSIANTVKVVWIDHHKSAITEIDGYTIKDEYKLDGLRDTKFAACELTWKYYFPNEEMPEIVRLLGRYDCFGHKGTDEEQKVLEFQYGARQIISNYEEAYQYLSLYFENDFKEEGNGLVNEILIKGKSIYQYLCTEAKGIYKKAFPIWLTDFTYTEDKKLVHHQVPFLCVNQERFNPINFGIDYHKDINKGNKEEFTSDLNYDGFACFWYKDGKWMWSLYNDNGQVDCSLIAKQYGGGGHKGASGFVCDNETMLNIINSK
ncbi:MAG: hypothetical protein GY775_19400 [Candidatus Scalindua sp.]|nr:hypothetical protein [Candidatus Scalindua sp.]